jgi:pimeloyl-ACP methyl ester carboxylesterase
MLGEVDRLPDVSTYTFDYSRDSLDWVTSPPVGPRLAEAINCLAAATGRKVVIVAHSMGGLAARAAQAQPDAVTGVPTSDHVGLVVTVGTPWLGSQVLAIADHASDAASRIAPPLGAGLRVAVTVCGFIAERFPTAGMCGYGGVPGSAAGRAMVPGSPELAALPPWGAGVQVHAVATRVILQVHPGLGAVPFPVDVGDVPVSVESATTSGAVDGRTYVHDCTIADYELLPVFRDRLCFHWNHLSSRPLVDFVRARVAFYVGSQPPPASTTSSEPGFSLPSGTLGVLLVLAFFYLIYRLLFRRSR